MTNFELYKPYKTRGGWKAVVLMIKQDGSMLVWHENDDVLCVHYKDGVHCIGEIRYDLISEWVEPVKRTFWLNVYKSGTSSAYDSQERALSNIFDRDPEECIDTIRIDYVQGATHYVAKGEL